MPLLLWMTRAPVPRCHQADAMGAQSDITTPLLWRSDLLARGHSPDQIRWALTSQRWLALRRGVYVERETFTSLSAREQHLLRALALHQSLNCDHVLSHHTALAFHGLAPLHPLMDVTLTTHRDLRRHVVGAQVFTTRDLALHRIDHVTPWGTSLPVTSLARTIVDIARTCDLPTTLVAAESALSRDLTQRRDWGDVLDQLPRWPGVNQAQRSLERHTVRIHSCRGSVGFSSPSDCLTPCVASLFRTKNTQWEPLILSGQTKQSLSCWIEQTPLLMLNYNGCVTCAGKKTSCACRDTSFSRSPPTNSFTKLALLLLGSTLLSQGLLPKKPRQKVKYPLIASLRTLELLAQSCPPQPPCRRRVGRTTSCYRLRHQSLGHRRNSSSRDQQQVA